jgi:hypothetical protein
MDRLSHSDGMRGFRPPVDRPRSHDWTPEGHNPPKRADSSGHSQKPYEENLEHLDKAEFALGERFQLLRMTRDMRPRAWELAEMLLEVVLNGDGSGPERIDPLTVTIEQINAAIPQRLACRLEREVRNIEAIARGSSLWFPVRRAELMRDLVAAHKEKHANGENGETSQSL